MGCFETTESTSMTDLMAQLGPQSIFKLWLQEISYTVSIFPRREREKPCRFAPFLWLLCRGNSASKASEV